MLESCALVARLLLAGHLLAGSVWASPAQTGGVRPRLRGGEDEGAKPVRNATDDAPAARLTQHVNTGAQAEGSVEDMSSSPPPEAQAQNASSSVLVAEPEQEDAAKTFEWLRREEGWNVSPYVSQERLDVLWESLFSNYTPEVPPVPENGRPLLIGVGINFVKFRQLDEVAGTMDMALNLRLCWDDVRLAFDAQEFFGMEWVHSGDKVAMMSNQIWTPDITILNEVSGLQSRSLESTPLVLSDNKFRRETGVNVLWSQPLDVKTICSAQMNLYPFDEQSCDIVVGSWSFPNRQMLLRPQPFFFEDTIHTPEFSVQNITVTTRKKLNKATGQSFDEVVYRVRLTRYSHFYVINFILPMVSLTALTVATMWLSSGNAGVRVNASSLVLLVVISVIFITASTRPAVHGDIWMDSFQSHCLAIAIASFLESVFVDFLTRVGGLDFLHKELRIESLDAMGRFAICFTMVGLIFNDARQVHRHHPLTLYTSFQSRSGRAEVTFVYSLFAGLLMTSTGSVVWIFIPRRWQRYLEGAKDEDAPQPEPGPNQVVELPISSKTDRCRKRTRSEEGLDTAWSASVDDSVEELRMAAPMSLSCRRTPLLERTVSPYSAEEFQSARVHPWSQEPPHAAEIVDIVGVGPFSLSSTYDDETTTDVGNTRRSDGSSRSGPLSSLHAAPPTEQLFVAMSAEAGMSDASLDDGAPMPRSLAASAGEGCRLACSSMVRRIVRVVDGVVMLVPQEAHSDLSMRLSTWEASELTREGDMFDELVAAGRLVQVLPEGELLEDEMCLLIPVQPGVDKILRSTSTGSWEEIEGVSWWRGYAIVSTDRLGTFVPVASGLRTLLDATPQHLEALPSVAEVVLDGLVSCTLELQVSCGRHLFLCGAPSSSSIARWDSLAQMLRDHLPQDESCSVHCGRANNEALVEVLITPQRMAVSQNSVGAQANWSQRLPATGPLAYFRRLQEAFTLGVCAMHLEDLRAEFGISGAGHETLNLVQFAVREAGVPSVLSDTNLDDTTLSLAQDALPDPLAMIFGKEMEFMPL